MVNTQSEGKNIKAAAGGNDTKYLGGNDIFLLTPATTAIQIEKCFRRIPLREYKESGRRI